MTAHEVTPGFKFNDWEMRGVPLRLEIGPKDVEKGSVMAARRDIPGREGKSFLPQENIDASVSALLESIHTSLFERAKAFRDSHIFEASNYEELTQAVRKWLGIRLVVRQMSAVRTTSRKTPRRPPAAFPWTSPEEAANAWSAATSQRKGIFLPVPIRL